MKTRYCPSSCGPLQTTIWLFAIALQFGLLCDTEGALVSRTYMLAIDPQPSGDFSISWVGQGATLEWSTDLVNWSAAGTLNPFAAVPLDPVSFYRLSLPPPVTSRPNLIRGYIVARVSQGSNTLQDVYLPGVEVYLQDQSSGLPGISVLTDLSGRFTLPSASNETYRICWQAPGFVSGCTLQNYRVQTANLHVGKIVIPTSSRPGETVVYGETHMKDGSSPRTFEPLANVNVFATVELLDTTGHSLQEVYVNNFGEYLLPRVPANGPVVFRAKCENAVTELTLLPESNLAGAPFQPINLVIENNPPRLQGLFAADPITGRWLKTMQVGGTARLTARATDPDGDTVEFRWIAGGGSGTLSALAGPQVLWTPPNTQGLYSVTVIANDRKGGYARSTATLRVDDAANAGVPFSGRVAAVDASDGIADARIEVNGQITVTGSEGYFYFRVPDSDRFVLNIRKAGYGLVSQIYDKNITGGRWTLALASLFSVDPTQPIDLTDQRDDRNCPGPLSYCLNWTNYSQLVQPQWQDGSNHVVLPFAPLEVPLPGIQQCSSDTFCGPGIRVQIPANSLVDQNGQPPTGNVTVQLFTVDVSSPFQMPGDYTALMPNGTTQTMESYGAGGIEITDGSKKFNLKPGASALVAIPVDSSELVTGNPVPPTIPLLYYNETLGVWTQEGTATLVGNSYFATVSHFSTINTDLIKQNQSCVRINSEDPSMPGNYLLEYFVPRPGMAPRHDIVNIDNSVVRKHIIYNLPSMVNIVLVPIDPASKIPLGTFVVNTGDPQNPISPNLPNDPPTYAACSTEVMLKHLGIPKAPNSGEFLHGLYSFEGLNLSELVHRDSCCSGFYDCIGGGITCDQVHRDEQRLNDFVQATANYYNHIDPLGKRASFADFKTANRMFGVPGELYVVYANGGDLGFGRNMHFVKNGDDVAAYVTNFGTGTTDDQTDANDAAANRNPGATVTMEYSAIEGDPSGERVVKFYAYDQAGSPISHLNLDGAGERPIPQLCMVCHGGEYPGGPVVGKLPPFNSLADVKLGSKFLPFDLHYYTFPKDPHFSGLTKASQQPAFKTLNERIIKDTDPVIGEIITEWYKSSFVQDEDAVVPGWRDPSPPANAVRESMYRDVIARTCRTCHAASSFPKLRFDKPSNFLVADVDGGAKLYPSETRLCQDHIMPHSKVTHDKFWKSANPNLPAVFRLFGDRYGATLPLWDPTIPCPDFTKGGTAPPTPMSEFTTTIEPILKNHSCLGCHSGNTPPPNDTFSPCGPCLTAGKCKGLNLQIDAYANLVGKAANQLPNMNQVTPNDYLNSYLWRKLDGSQGVVGGCGNKMPIGGSLSPTDIDTIKNWIMNGAK